MKIVINKCYGGFGLSDLAYQRMIELGIPVKEYIQEKRGQGGLLKKNLRNDGNVIFDRTLSRGEGDFNDDKHIELLGRYWEVWIRYDNRNDALLIKVVEELGKKSWGRHAKLEIVEIPDGVKWHIEEYDGMESIHEDHKSW